MFRTILCLVNALTGKWIKSISAIGRATVLIAPNVTPRYTRHAKSQSIASFAVSANVCKIKGLILHKVQKREVNSHFCENITIAFALLFVIARLLPKQSSHHIMAPFSKGSSAEFALCAMRR